MKNIVVLNDGETFSDIEGCSVWAVPDDMSGDEIELALHDVREASEEDDRMLNSPIMRVINLSGLGKALK